MRPQRKPDEPASVVWSDAQPLKFESRRRFEAIGPFICAECGSRSRHRVGYNPDTGKAVMLPYSPTPKDCGCGGRRFLYPWEDDVTDAHIDLDRMLQRMFQ